MQIYYLERTFPKSDFRDGDQNIIETMIEMVKNNESLNITNVAEKNFTSSSSISRLSKRAGFRNYSEFVFRLTQSVQVENFENDDIFDYVRSNKTEKESHDILKKCFSSKLIYLFGEGFCEPVIDYFYRKLLQSKLMAVNLDGLEVSLLNNSYAPVLITISQSGENKHGLTKIKEIKDNDGIVIAFTAVSNSTFSQSADLCYTIDAGNNLNNDNINRNYFYGNTLNFIEYLISIYASDSTDFQSN